MWRPMRAAVWGTVTRAPGVAGAPVAAVGAAGRWPLGAASCGAGRAQGTAAATEVKVGSKGNVIAAPPLSGSVLAGTESVAVPPLAPVSTSLAGAGEEGRVKSAAREEGPAEVVLPTAFYNKLVEFAAHGNVRMVRGAMRLKGYDAGRVSSRGLHPLLVAAAQGHRKVVQQLLSDPDVDPAVRVGGLNLKKGTGIEGIKGFRVWGNGCNALHLAVKADDVRLIRLLLAREGEVGQNAKNALMRTPLMEAICRGKVKAMSVLLEAGGTRIDLEGTDRGRMTPMMKAIETGRMDMVRILTRDPRMNPYGPLLKAPQVASAPVNKVAEFQDDGAPVRAQREAGGVGSGPAPRNVQEVPMRSTFRTGKGKEGEVEEGEVGVEVPASTAGVAERPHDYMAVADKLLPGDKALGTRGTWQQGMIRRRRALVQINGEVPILHARKEVPLRFAMKVGSVQALRIFLKESRVTKLLTEQEKKLLAKLAITDMARQEALFRGGLARRTFFKSTVGDKGKWRRQIRRHLDLMRRVVCKLPYVSSTSMIAERRRTRAKAHSLRVQVEGKGADKVGLSKPLQGERVHNLRDAMVLADWSPVSRKSSGSKVKVALVRKLLRERRYKKNSDPTAVGESGLPPLHEAVYLSHPTSLFRVLLNDRRVDWNEGFDPLPFAGTDKHLFAALTPGLSDPSTLGKNEATKFWPGVSVQGKAWNMIMDEKYIRFVEGARRARKNMMMRLFAEQVLFKYVKVKGLERYKEQEIRDAVERSIAGEELERERALDELMRDIENDMALTRPKEFGKKVNGGPLKDAQQADKREGYENAVGAFAKLRKEFQGMNPGEGLDEDERAIEALSPMEILEAVAHVKQFMYGDGAESDDGMFPVARGGVRGDHDRELLERNRVQRDGKVLAAPWKERTLEILLALEEEAYANASDQDYKAMYGNMRGKKSGWSPLMFACELRNVRAVRALLRFTRPKGDERNGRSRPQRTLEVNAENSLGRFPLLVAAANGCHDIVTLLLADERTDATKANKFGVTALGAAVAVGDDAMVAHLKRHLAAQGAKQ